MIHPPLFVEGNERAGIDDGKVRCLRCGKIIKGSPVLMYRDWRVGEFHDFGNIPSDGAPNPFPDGPYEFGPDCAEILRRRAKYYLIKAGFGL